MARQPRSRCSRRSATNWSICTGRTITSRCSRRNGSSRLLDGFAHAEEALREYQESFRRLQSLVAEERALSSAETVREQELDLLRHQVQEIAAAKLEPDEEEEIHARYRLASNSRRLIELATSISRQLSEADNAVLNQLAETQRLLRELEKIDPGLAESSARARRRGDRIDRNRAHPRSLRGETRSRSGTARAARSSA